MPWLVSLSPTLMMLRRFRASPTTCTSSTSAAPRALADANPLLYRFLLNKWYFDELYDFLFVRPAFWLGRVFWKGGDGVIIDGFGPDGVSARVLDVTRNVVRLQTGYIYHYAFAMLLGVAALRHLVSVRGNPLMSGFWILSGLLVLPLVGAFCILLLRGDDEATLQQRALDRAVDDADHLRPQPRRLGALQHGLGRLPARRAARLVLARHHLQARRRRHFDAVRAADDLPDAVLHRRLVAVDPDARQGIYDRLPRRSRR